MPIPSDPAKPLPAAPNAAQPAPLRAAADTPRRQQVAVAYEAPPAHAGGSNRLQQAWARVPDEPEPQRRSALIARIATQLQQKNAALVAHYYVHPDIQDLAEQTGGLVSDSLEMARFGRDHAAQTLLVAGVRFMGETAKILSPHKTIIVPELEATCSLDLGCPEDAFAAWCAQHPERTVVVYANTSAAVKARAHWMVTSGCALAVVRHLHARGEKILWAPDRHLGAYIQQQTGADMLLWNGACIVHDEFKAFELQALKAQHPGCRVLAHPESPATVLALADYIGSTTGILQAARTLPAQDFIVATDKGLMHKLRAQNPDKRFLEAPTGGSSATCKSCAHCPWMAMNSLQSLADALESGANRIELDPALGARARQPIERMLAFTAQHAPGPSPAPAVGPAASWSAADSGTGLVPHLGAA